MEPILPCPETTTRPVHRTWLPAELMERIVDSVVESSTPRAALLPASHPTTKTLLSLARACRATHSRAQKLLYEHCVCLDTCSRTGSFLRCWGARDTITTTTTRRRSSSSPQEMRRRVPAMFLAPFDGPMVVDEGSAALWARGILFHLRRTLRRLVLRLPPPPRLDSSRPRSARGILREGLEQLTALEEFVCLDEYPRLWLAGDHHHHQQQQQQSAAAADALSPSGEIWGRWTRLERLLLFGADLGDEALWVALARMPRLTEVVLARPRNVGAVDVKRAYLAAAESWLEEEEEEEGGGGGGGRGLGSDTGQGGAKVRVVLMDVASDMDGVQRHGWEPLDPQGVVLTLELYEVPTAYYGDETRHETVVAWVKRGALNAQLWDWRGDVLE